VTTSVRETDSTINKWVNIQQRQCNEGRHHEQVPHHSQVSAVQQFTHENTAQSQRYSQMLCIQGVYEGDPDTLKRQTKVPKDQVNYLTWVLSGVFMSCASGSGSFGSRAGPAAP